MFFFTSLWNASSGHSQLLLIRRGGFSFQLYYFASRKQRWDLQYFPRSLPMATLCNHSRTPSIPQKIWTNTNTERGLLMQWQHTLKEGPRCNQLLLSALAHRPKNLEECHYVLHNSKSKGRVQQFWFTSFARTGKITGFLLIWHFYRNWGILPQFTHFITGTLKFSWF